MQSNLNNAVNALLNHLTIFFSNPPPRELMSPHIATPATPVHEDQFFEASEWSFLPRYSSALALCKWSLAFLETLAKRLMEFLPWGEDIADAIRIAVGGIRERLVRATLVAWREGRCANCSPLIVDTEHFYVLEDWVIDKEK